MNAESEIYHYVQLSRMVSQVKRVIFIRVGQKLESWIEQENLKGQESDNKEREKAWKHEIA